MSDRTYRAVACLAHGAAGAVGAGLGMQTSVSMAILGAFVLVMLIGFVFPVND